MTKTDHRTPSMRAGRVELPGGTLSYGKIVNRREICLSAHVPYDDHEVLMISTFNERNDHRPMRLTPAEAACLRDALNLYLADHPVPETPTEA